MKDTIKAIKQALKDSNVKMKKKTIETLAHYIHYGCGAHYSDYDVEYEYSKIEIKPRATDDGFDITLVDFQKLEDGGTDGDLIDFHFGLVEYMNKMGCLVYGDCWSVRRLTFVAQELFLDFVM